MVAYRYPLVSALRDDLKSMYKDNWLYVLSKYTGYAEGWLHHYFERHQNYYLNQGYEEFSDLILNEDAINFAKETLLNPLHISAMCDHYRDGDIKYIEVKLYGKLLKLNFKNEYGCWGRKMPLLNKVVGKDDQWTEYLVICENNELDARELLQKQVDWLNKQPVWNSFLRPNASDYTAMHFYFERRQDARYIQQKRSNGYNRTFEVLPYAEFLEKSYLAKFKKTYPYNSKFQEDFYYKGFWEAFRLHQADL
ncbi:hypothetical protein QDS01_18365 [Acinetobacter nosocomialis]|uniref:hypothetical protein n=1 Tax=Acinetobacter nosocomialis TaxID=106654 RepID=UPI00244918CE|nr:hypothetical protein [Acinetobacter nosocomialis]MDH2636878.1 hypothetical protein [Acinetobacter nosocomialis]